jgi:membrane fusion protein (multidrug efflux system)
MIASRKLPDVTPGGSGEGASFTTDAGKHRTIDNLRGVRYNRQWQFAPSRHAGNRVEESNIRDGAMMASIPVFRDADIRLTSAFLLAVVVALAGCGKEEAKAPQRGPLEVTVMTVAARDVPVNTVFVAQTQSSQAVNIQARVSGFLDKRVYTEGAVVRAGQVLFQMDQKPFIAQVDAQTAAMQRNQASLQVAQANLARTKPLAEQNALSQKDLDDAQGQYEQAAAAVAQSRAQLEEAKLNLSYTTIRSPVTGVSSFAVVPDGTYVNATNSQLTTISVLTPIWINFSVSENEMQRIRDEVSKGLLKLPDGRRFIVEIELADGAPFPHTGLITFADPSYNSQTGTFLLRATVDNPDGVLRPNQYVRARLDGAVRPNAILVPQRAVQQGAKGHFVWIINKSNEAELRPVVVGDWYGDGWFIAQGLAAGEQIAVDGTLRLAPGASVKTSPYVPKPVATSRGGAATGAAAASSSASVAQTIQAVIRFASGSATLDAVALKSLGAAAEELKRVASPVYVTGYTDRIGARTANMDLAKRRANAVRDALVVAGLPAERVRLLAPRDVTGAGSDDEARRVDIAIGL